MYAETTTIYALLLVLVGTLGDSRETDGNCSLTTDRWIDRLVNQSLLKNDQTAGSAM